MTGSVCRLPQGGRIDRSRVLRFTFDGKAYQGFEGDTLASALLANGVHLIGRSFKYHRPRGVFSAGVEEPGALVELDGDDASGNRPATTVRLTDGLVARSVNCWPSPRFDLGAATQLVARMLPAGFYYKTFMWPDWRIFEPAIRRAAGMAGAPAKPPETGRFETRNAHADVLVAGAGPAGLMAAYVAARAGARVVLADDRAEPGGSLLDRRLTINGDPAAGWAATLWADLAAMPEVTALRDTTVWAYREHNLLILNQRNPDRPGLIERTWRVRAKQTVLATGATERMIVFPGNDRPGVMLASGVQAYLNRYAVRPGKRAVILTNNDSAYQAAADMGAAGIELAAIIDTREAVSDACRKQVPGVEIWAGAHVVDTLGTQRLTGVVTSQNTTPIPCDLLAVSGGWSPNVHLHSQARGTLRWDPDSVAFVPEATVQPSHSAGAANGQLALPEALASGAAQGVAAAEAAGFTPNPPPLPAAEEAPYTVEPFWATPKMKPGAKAFVDLQNDVTAADIALALREGYESVEHVKRYTTGGMGLDQGKTGNVNIIGLVAREQGRAVGDVGTTTFRSPYTPVSFGSLAGQREGSVVLPYRHTPLTDWNHAQGAFMYEAGARWRRPGYFPRDGETFQETVNREARAVRQGVGVYDGSPLGTFELKGRDTDRFLDLIYTNTFSTLKDGAGRYGIMLSEDGLILDDGVSFRLGQSRWLMSTSTGHADAVHHHMERLRRYDRPDWHVHVTNVTSQWANATVCGPKARDVMQALGTDLDLSRDALPFMHLAEGMVAGLPSRVIRVSFTGEISFEINVRPRDLPTLWERILEAGAPFGIQPVGSEANHVLRVEKGFLSLGHEVDGTVDPFDLGMGWIVSKKKPDFIGKRAMEIRRSARGPRWELVGLMPEDVQDSIPEGAPLTPDGAKVPSEGFVSACVFSVVHNRWVALGLLQDGRARIGHGAHVRLRNRVIGVHVVAPCFHDPDGERLRG
ncbi:MAG: sarcosine oxidase subunit alpha family protein [Pseudomonadota bacterium]